MVLLCSMRVAIFVIKMCIVIELFLLFFSARALSILVVYLLLIVRVINFLWSIWLMN